MTSPKNMAARLTPLRLVFSLLLLAAGLARATTVGMTGEVKDQKLPGPELVVKKMENPRGPFILRITAVYPHGSDFRYDFAYTGLEPGKYDLCTLLEHKDKTPVAGLPPVEVEITPVLPPGPPPMIEDHPVAPFLPRLGGYRMLLWILGIVWIVGFIALLCWRRKSRAATAPASVPEPTVAERLRPLITEATAGRLDRDGQAKLERLLLGFWRQRLDLDAASPAEAIRTLRNHPEGGELLRRVEDWLHRPVRPESEAVSEAEIATLLQPYLTTQP